MDSRFKVSLAVEKNSANKSNTKDPLQMSMQSNLSSDPLRDFYELKKKIAKNEDSFK